MCLPKGEDVKGKKKSLLSKYSIHYIIEHTKLKVSDVNNSSTKLIFPYFKPFAHNRQNIKVIRSKRVSVASFPVHVRGDTEGTEIAFNKITPELRETKTDEHEKQNSKIP